jgi:hypothetical protein
MLVDSADALATSAFSESSGWRDRIRLLIDIRADKSYATVAIVAPTSWL